jgi:hypothetical protein
MKCSSQVFDMTSPLDGTAGEGSTGCGCEWGGQSVTLGSHASNHTTAVLSVRRAWMDATSQAEDRTVETIVSLLDISDYAAPSFLDVLPRPREDRFVDVCAALSVQIFETPPSSTQGIQPLDLQLGLLFKNASVDSMDK